MPRKIKVLWVGCILIVFFSFVYFSIQGNIKAHRGKEEARVKQEFRIKNKKLPAKEIDSGQTFKVDPIKEIKELNALGKYEDAVRYAEGVATLNPNQAKIYTWWGVSLVKFGKREEAIDKFVKSASLDANYSKTYLYWGLTLAMDRKPRAAIKKYEKVIELEPENSNAYAYWGAALEQLGNHSGATEKLEHALEIMPNNSNVFSTLIDALVNQKKYNEAWEVVKKARKARVAISSKLLSKLAELFPEPTL
ncbi:tetratricopeptide repeat protein [Nitrospinaceae bacterium]|nr:tetratricopeptide repeat protein [Nitrospinaceae bacterium]